MFGAFKPSAPLSGGLLWKIPWRLSPPQKLRHRRRMRRVDNVVSVLDTALKRQAATAVSPSSRPQHSATSTDPEPAQAPTQSASNGKATPLELLQTAEGQRILENEATQAQQQLRHGRGPRQGEVMPGSSHTRTGDAARREGTIKLIERWKVDMPTEQEMLPKDKYTMFDRKARGYRKGVHKLPKWTRVSQRLNPPGF
ncbi:hypothetical protein LTR86_004631 [Recurvomyces mirabilis]|nr:hypothetical protein LTR86_004631 [Recurvomyces mirabilis]